MLQLVKKAQKVAETLFQPITCNFTSLKCWVDLKKYTKSICNMLTTALSLTVFCVKYHFLHVSHIFWIKRLLCKNYTLLGEHDAG